MKNFGGSILVNLSDWQKLQEQLNEKTQKEKNRMDGGIKVEPDIITPTVKTENEIVHRMQNVDADIKNDVKPPNVKPTIANKKNENNNVYQENSIKKNIKKQNKLKRKSLQIKYSWKSEIGKCFADFLNKNEIKKATNILEKLFEKDECTINSQHILHYKGKKLGNIYVLFNELYLTEKKENKRAKQLKELKKILYKYKINH